MDAVNSNFQNQLYSNPSGLSLESELKSDWMVNVDMDYTSLFEQSLVKTREEYFEPNEEHPEAIKPHLDLAEKKIIVSTGTERSLFDLLFGDFEGLVIRDVNPLTAAYHHYNTLLLRLCDIKEYNQLSAPVMDMRAPSFIPTKIKAAYLMKQAPFLERMAIVSKKIEESEMSNELKSFYQKNLNACGAVYLSQEHKWKWSSGFDACHYHKNEAQFLRLQEYARKGMIVPTTGDINQLEFLNPKKIPFKVSVVDTSNIVDYVPINLQGLSDGTRIITTTFAGVKGVYHSCVHKPFSEKEASDFNKLFNDVLLPCHESHSRAEKAARSLKKGSLKDRFNITSQNIYSADRLEVLQKYINKNVISIPGINPIDMKSNIIRINTLSPSDTQKLCEHEKITHFLSKLVKSSLELNPDAYMRFSKISGWNEAFEDHFMKEPSALITLLGRLKEAHLLNELIENLGVEKLDALIANGSENKRFEDNWKLMFNASTENGIKSIL